MLHQKFKTRISDAIESEFESEYVFESDNSSEAWYIGLGKAFLDDWSQGDILIELFIEQESGEWKQIRQLQT